MSVPTPDRLVKPELLAPAGDWQAMRAAVANGANAVYFGLGSFNARHRATNFTVEQLPEVMAYLHGHNVRGYVAFNTLIFSDELPEAARFIIAAARAGVDALIVQDLGLARLIHRVAPTLPIHGSTQMTLTEPRGIEFVRSLGVERVILARELSIGEIQRITAGTTTPVEVFVHGALCVAYSGQCLTSESLGGRSANRGQCAQACRLPYDLVVDGQYRDLADKAYLLSPQDLAAYDLIGDLVKLGVSSFKIEGRLKSAHYVAATTQTYRAALDAAQAGQPFQINPQQHQDLAQSFSRGFTHGFLDGPDHQTLVHARFPKSRGIRVGTVIGKTGDGMVVEVGRGSDEATERRSDEGEEGRHEGTEAQRHRGQEKRVGAASAVGSKNDGRNGRRAGTEASLNTQNSALSTLLKPGDGVVFDEGHPEQDEQGGRVVSVVPVANRGSRMPSLQISFHPGDVNLSAVAIGSIVWKTDDPAVRKRLEQSYSREMIAHRVPLHAHAVASIGEKLRLTLEDAEGHRAEVGWDQTLQRAEKFPLTIDLLREQVGRLGQTPFELASVRLTGASEDSPADPVMVPKSVLNDLRRQAVEQIVRQRSGEQVYPIAEPDALEHLRADARKAGSAELHGPSASTNEPRLAVLVRTLEQLQAVIDWHPATGQQPQMVYCDFEDVRRYKDAVALARAAQIPIALATLRIVKPTEEGLLRQIADCQPDAVLVRNLAAVSFYSQQTPRLPMLGDYSLNVANELTASIFAEAGLVRMVPSYDLNWQQMAALLQRSVPGLFEIVIHQHMPMFHMEHCVFAHTLSNGKDYRDCGRPCERHQVDLKDRVGQAHPLIPDVGCRNTLYNAAAQSAAEYVPRMRELGLHHFRVELLRENPGAAHALLNRYARVLAGLDDGRATWRQLRVLNQLGVTRGTFDHV